jgi:hypothetical protein
MTDGAAGFAGGFLVQEVFDDVALLEHRQHTSTKTLQVSDCVYIITKLWPSRCALEVLDG